jgi:hypothetical protein
MRSESAEAGQLHVAGQQTCSVYLMFWLCCLVGFVCCNSINVATETTRTGANRKLVEIRSEPMPYALFGLIVYLRKACSRKRPFFHEFVNAHSAWCRELLDAIGTTDGGALCIVFLGSIWSDLPSACMQVARRAEGGQLHRRRGAVAAANERKMYLFFVNGQAVCSGWADKPLC